MFKYFDYRCKRCGDFEKFVQGDDRNIPQECPHCGEQSERQVSPIRFKLDGTNPNNARAWDKWEKDRAKRIAEEQRKNS